MNVAVQDTDHRSWRRAATPRGVRRPMTSPIEPGGASSPSAPALAGLVVAIAERADRDAFAALFRHFAPRVKSYLLRMGTGAESAEELAQETLLTVWRRAAAFDPAKAAASTWIFTIARNLRIDRARREGRAIPGDDPSDLVCQNLPDQVLGATQDQARIARALDQLPRDQARVIIMAFFSDKPHSEIAGELGLPLGTVKSRLRLAMARLRAALDDPT
jgi:RNA polymerase sigma factor (sigma-70 family)